MTKEFELILGSLDKEQAPASLALDLAAGKALTNRALFTIRWTGDLNTHGGISRDARPERTMPQVFRVMRKEPDGLPTVSPKGLGVRPGDVDLDAQNNVLVNGKGMSVAPNWRDINVIRIPKRLRPILVGAGGSNNTFCFRMGNGPFQQGSFANGLTLEPDTATHGNVAPAVVVPFTTYEADIAATRPDWQEDET